MKRLAFGVVFLWASIALAEPITVTAPADRQVLQGGSLATITWKADAPLPRGVEEWEAFLSVDGGRYYATRITPHLSIDIRSFEWRVPNVASNDVRLLIRVGDEREEREIDVPLRFSIVADPFVPTPVVVHAARNRGESARPGDPAVALWTSGDRDGDHLVEERAPVDASWDTGVHKNADPNNAFLATPVVANARPASTFVLFVSSAPRVHAISPLLARDILVLVRRRNI